MNIKDHAGAECWAMFMNEASLTPSIRAAFLRWVRENHADKWRTFAESHMLPEDSEVLVHKAAVAATDAILYALRLHLDQLAATVEARQIVEGDEPDG